jgi:hypothetical protein
MLPRMRRFLVALVVPVLLLALAACSDDDEGGSSDTTEADGSSDTEGADANVDTEELTQQFEDAILGEGSDSDWHVESVTGNEVVIAPDEGVEVTEDQANTVCGAVTTVAFNVLPTAVITVNGSDGQPLVTSEGAEGCHAVGDDS